MISVRMLTKTARWLTLTTGFHPIQRAPGYDRSSPTGGTQWYGYVGMSYWQDCGWSDRTLELRRDCARAVRNRRSHRGFSFPDPRPHSVLKSIFKAQSSRRLYLQCKMCWREARNSPAPSKFGLMRKTEQQAFPSCQNAQQRSAAALQSGNTLWKI